MIGKRHGISSRVGALDPGLRDRTEMGLDGRRVVSPPDDGEVRAYDVSRTSYGPSHRAARPPGQRLVMRERDQHGHQTDEAGKKSDKHYRSMPPRAGQMREPSPGRPA